MWLDKPSHRRSRAACDLDKPCHRYSRPTCDWDKPGHRHSQHWGYNTGHGGNTCKELVMWLGKKGRGVQKNAASKHCGQASEQVDTCGKGRSASKHCEQASEQVDTGGKGTSDARASKSKQQQRARVMDVLWPGLGSQVEALPSLVEQQCIQAGHVLPVLSVHLR